MAAAVAGGPAANERKGIIRSALRGGGLAVVVTGVFSLGLTLLFFAMGATRGDTTHWISVLSVTLVLLRVDSIQPEHFELSFILSMVVSIFAQGTIQEYFLSNGLYANTRLWLPRIRGLNTGARPIGLTVPLGEARLVWLVLVLLAAFSIILVNTDSFYLHLLSTLAYLGIVAVIDLVYWRLTGPEAPARTYRSVPAHTLFREFNRQLVVRIDIGVIVVAVIPGIRVVRALDASADSPFGFWLRLVQGLTAHPSIEEVAFFTGVASFCLVSTGFLVFDALYDFDRILREQHVVDLK